ncbi:MAG TPA: hypothetical protein VI485_25900 [Vicinamibacterales bacterium]|nr:hypothetical protein [Vicinamibacterales bacterium]
MRPLKYIGFVIALCVPAVLYAGQIYGTIVSEGQGLKGANIEIQCGKEAALTGTTAADGAYRINVPQQGQCTLALPSYAGRPSAVIFSGPNPSAFNFDLVKLGDGKFELKRR